MLSFEQSSYCPLSNLLIGQLLKKTIPFLSLFPHGMANTQSENPQIAAHFEDSQIALLNLQIERIPRLLVLCIERCTAFYLFSTFSVPSTFEWFTSSAETASFCKKWVWKGYKKWMLYIPTRNFSFLCCFQNTPVQDVSVSVTSVVETRLSAWMVEYVKKMQMGLTSHALVWKVEICVHWKWSRLIHMSLGFAMSAKNVFRHLIQTLSAVEFVNLCRIYGR